MMMINKVYTVVLKQHWYLDACHVYFELLCQWYVHLISLFIVFFC